MASKIKTIQWNIGGGKILAEGQDPTRLSSYSDDGLQHIIDLIDDEQPDIVTLQETHPHIPHEIADALGYVSINHQVSTSHIDPNYQLGHGLISDFDIHKERLDFFINPLWEAEWEDGTRSTAHPKGISSYQIEHEDGDPILVQNLHLTPLRAFGVEPLSDRARPILRDVEAKVGEYVGRRILQGDFNIDERSLREVLPGLFELGLEEVVQEEPTTPKQRRLDHILYAGMTVVKSVVVKDVLTDHYPIVTTFKI